MVLQGEGAAHQIHTARQTSLIDLEGFHNHFLNNHLRNYSFSFGDSPGGVPRGVPWGNPGEGSPAGSQGGLQSIKLINSIVIRGFWGGGKERAAQQIHTA